MVTGVRDQRRTGIGDQRDVIASQQAREKATALFPLVVLVTGRQGGIDPEMLQQTNGMTRVFRSDQGHIAEYFQRPRAHVIQVADGRGHHVKRASSGLGSPWNISHSTHLSC
ncbi:hypothetical protein D3C79_708860 [compost metagenome]